MESPWEYELELPGSSENQIKIGLMTDRNDIIVVKSVDSSGRWFTKHISRKGWANPQRSDFHEMRRLVGFYQQVGYTVVDGKSHNPKQPKSKSKSIPAHEFGESSVLGAWFF